MKDKKRRKKWFHNLEAVIKKEKPLRLLWKSVRFRIIAITFVSMAILFGTLLFNNMYAIDVVHKQVFETNYRVLRLFMSNVDHAFDDVEKFFVGLQNSGNMITVSYTNSDVEFYTAQARLVKELDGSAPSHSYVDALFVYVKNREQYMDAVSYGIPGDERSRIKKMVVDIVESRDNETMEASEKMKGKWSWYWIGDEPYLIRILHMRDTYMGSCVKVSTLVEKLRKDGFGEMEYLSFCKLSGEELGNNLPKLRGSIKVNGEQEYYRSEDGREKYMLLSVPSQCGDYGLVALIRDKNALEELRSFQFLIWGLIGVLSFFLPAFVAAMRRWVLLPLRKLMTAMEALGQGQFDIRLQDDVKLQEFAAVNKTFDDMANQIQTLKIDVYEQKVQRQKAELQYMKLQVNPHFYINCLNVIHNLSLVNKNNLVQQMTVYLGKYLRYTMEGSALDRLDKEIACVKNYLQIQQLRFPDSIICKMEIGENISQVLVPPLMIQTFIENTVKYQVVAGEITHIFIRAVREEGNPRELCIEVWDDGDGYSEHVLECLKNNKKIFDERGEHYGICNVRQRLSLIYHEKARMSFCNHPETGGAYVKIIFPDDVV